MFIKNIYIQYIYELKLKNITKYRVIEKKMYFFIRKTIKVKNIFGLLTVFYMEILFTENFKVST